MIPFTSPPTSKVDKNSWGNEDEERGGEWVGGSEWGLVGEGGRVRDRVSEGR